MAREETCLAGGGDCGARLRAVDWRASPLGEPQSWPTALQTAVRIVLGSSFPMRLHWGEALVGFYNDAYAREIGYEHPLALAQPARDGGGAAWRRLAPVLDAVLAGETVPVDVARDAQEDPFVAEAWFTHCHSPLPGDRGRIEGVFVILIETTRRVHAENRLLAAKAALERQLEDQRATEAQLRLLNETLETRIFDALAERRQAEEQLRQSQKLEAVGQLTGGVAHDFNNLLTIIRSSVDFLRRRDLPEERRRRYVDAISDTVDRAAKLTGQLLAFARRQPLKPEVFDVGRRVEAVAELVRPLVGSRIRIELELCPEPCFAQADVGQFETALVNLAVNARDAMDGAGRIDITVSSTDALPAVRGHLRRVGPFVSIAVADSGCGVAPEKLEAIFEPFYTTKEVGKGTGLGLSQVFGFAKQSEGEITVVSSPGAGASFTLYLPRVDAAPAEETIVAKPHDRVHAREQASVLVVEDNEAVGRFSTELLQDLGYRTTWAANGREALDLLAEDPDRFNLVFSDVVMPGMNGVDLARAVRARHPGLPVVLTSGYSHVLAEEGRHGFELIQKPYSVEALSHVLRKATLPQG